MTSQDSLTSGLAMSPELGAKSPQNHALQTQNSTSSQNPQNTAQVTAGTKNTVSYEAKFLKKIFSKLSH